MNMFIARASLPAYCAA